MTFERAFRLYSYLLLLAGFFSLFASGAVSPPLAGVYLLAVLATARFGNVVLSYTVQLLLVLGMLGWFLVEVSLFSPVMEALVHLILLMSLLKLVSALTGRDYLLLYLISFVFVLLASTYTISAFFLVTLAIYIFCAILAFMLFETRAAYLEIRRVTFSHKAYLQMSLTVTILIVLFAIPIFVVIPRGGVSFLRRSGDSLAQMTGFSDRVVFGDLGRILGNERIVMRVRTNTPPEMLPADIKWRGIALDRFDGTVWSNTRRNEQSIYQNKLKAFIVPRPRRQQETQLRQMFFVEPFTNIVFGAPDVISISFGGRAGYVVEDGNHSFTYLPAQARRVTYVVDSDIVPRGQRLVAAQRAWDTPSGMDAYLQLPAIAPRIRALAQEITRDKPTDVARALALESYLNRNYRYSLENEPGSAADPLADFLFEHKTGHCEYFAAAQAVMLRSIGIPCRLVNGFRRGEFNSWSDHFVVRQSDAHSWVEAYFPGGGWIEFDPTPAAERADRYWFARLSTEWLDALDAFWTEVIAFDRIGQATLFQSTGRELFRFLSKAGRLVGRLQALRTVLTDEFLATRLSDLALLFWLLSGGLVVFAFGYRYRRYLSIFVRRSILHQRADRLAPEYYLELLEVLKRKGFRRAQSETPLEFAERIRSELNSSVPRWVTELYYGNRFGSLPLEARQLSEIYAGLRELRKRRR